MPNLSFTDSHAHVDMEPFDADRDGVISCAREASVDTIVNIALGPEKEKIERAYRLTQATNGMFMAAGVHPHDAAKMDDATPDYLREIASRPKVVAIGEIGLDYFYEHSPRETQRKVFGCLLDLALEMKKPVSIHSRDAFDDTYSLVRDRNLFRTVGGVLHCFTGTAKEAEAFLAEGAYISFSGIITFKKAENVREAARVVPLERMLIETDAPFLAPEPHRGKRNEPAFVVRVAETIAALKGLLVSDIAHATTINAKSLFGIK